MHPIASDASDSPSLRDAGALDPDIAHYLIALFAEDDVGSRVLTDPELNGIGERMEAIEAEEGLRDGESFYVGSGPPEWEKLARDWDVVFERQQRELLESMGEREMARELMLRRDDYDAATERGRVELWGGPPLGAM